ncbi:hypothetical protein [Nocardia sp. NPDC047654]|uniref:hypothetical protein n=1 Tax=Nocardia sp. NPDC047654 TaxID=3364314 RepID=UPI00371C1101
MAPTLKLRARSKASRAQAREATSGPARLIHCDDLGLGAVHAGERADALSEVPVQVAAVGELEERRMRGRRGRHGGVHVSG